MLFMQVLSQSELRAAYDQQLAQQKLQAHIAPAETIFSKDLDHIAGTNLLTHDCRCGGKYIVSHDDLLLYTLSLLPCDTCSQYVCLDTSLDKPMTSRSHA